MLDRCVPIETEKDLFDRGVLPTDVSRHCKRLRFRTITLLANNDPFLNPNTAITLDRKGNTPVFRVIYSEQDYRLDFF
ncbi:hypothetical protein ACHWQZ_G003535 [Mnemiopsis leidyi]